jgi:uncharacterized protein YndB with AHSA1/START domain
MAADNELVLSRLLNAPRTLVFDTFTEPRHISNWWGPNGFTTTTHEMAFEVGGRWRFTMHGPDGTYYEREKWVRSVGPDPGVDADARNQEKNYACSAG